ncbi:unnamed protein product, partial [Vitis vinifera]
MVRDNHEGVKPRVLLVVQLQHPINLLRLELHLPFELHLDCFLEMQEWEPLQAHQRPTGHHYWVGEDEKIGLTERCLELIGECTWCVPSSNRMSTSVLSKLQNCPLLLQDVRASHHPFYIQTSPKNQDTSKMKMDLRCSHLPGQHLQDSS